MKTALIPVLLAFAAATVQAAAPARAAAPGQAQEQSQGQAGPSLAQLKGEIDRIEDPDQLSQLAYLFNQQGEVEAELKALARRAALRPHLGLYKLEWAAALAREKRKSEAYTVLIGLQNAGYAYDLRNEARWAGIADTQVWNYLVDNFDANRQPFGKGRLLHTLPREDLLIESLAWDPGRKTLLVGGAREGAVYSVGKGGTLTPLLRADDKNGMWAVMDLAVDAKRGLLWVASTALPHFKNYDPHKSLGRAGIFKFDLKTGKFLKSYLSPAGGEQYFLSAIALGQDGAVYAVDGVNNAIYQVRDDQFRRLLHAPGLSSISAFTVSGDGKKLYLADVERGIIGVDLASLKPFDVRVPEKLTLESIAALKWHEGGLLILQGRIQPPRVLRLDLDAEGRSIAGVTPLEASHPAFSLPAALALDGDDVYVIGNSQKDNYDRFGLLKDKRLLEGTRIVQLQARQNGEAAPAKP